MKTVSYAITVCDETEEFSRLFDFLKKNVDLKNNEICVLADSTKVTKEIESILESDKDAKCFYRPFDYDFAAHKNYLIDRCDCDYIFQIDADEIPHEYLVKNLNEILEMNSDVDLIGVPRINIVEGITSYYLDKWKWRMNEKGYINFPDYQYRIFRNDGKIKFSGMVHEVPANAEVISLFPDHEKYALFHKKTISKQEKQNELYDRLMKFYR